MAHFYRCESHYLCWVSEARCTSSSLQRVMEFRFLFAGIILVAVIIDHVLVFSQPVAIRIGHGVTLLLGLLILGSWFFSGRGTNRRGTVLWMVRRHSADGAGVCNDDCCGVRDRYSRSGFSQQSAFRAA